MSDQLLLLMAQLNPTVGAIEANEKKITNVIEQYQKTHDLIVFPELILTGYPPEDLLLHRNFIKRVQKSLQIIAQITQNTHVIVGHPLEEHGKLYNALSIFHQGQVIATYKKQQLPNTGVFDEKRYFEPGLPASCLVQIKHHQIGFCICEDIWHQAPVKQIIDAGADILVCINASPYEVDKSLQRVEVVQKHIEQGICVVYVNLVGGQDELVFDGQSFVVGANGKIKAMAPAFTEHLQTVAIHENEIQSEIAPPLSREALLYQALCMGLRDYVNKNHFSGVVLGLSGGIDSALTLAIAVDALGAKCVEALLLPSQYTANISLEDSREMLEIHGIKENILSIESAFHSLTHLLEPTLGDPLQDIVEQNLQARIRGLILMAFSNTHQKLLLSTSNKSESAVGYTTLYGDMCGGFAPIKDVPKTLVYALAEYRNRLSRVIPERVISRAPSAELAHNQTDQDTLPDYAELDAIMSYYMHDKLAPDEIIAKGHASHHVTQVIELIQRHEYKRRQAPPGIKISKCAFGRDWRYPITYQPS